ncbi:MAG: adenylate/guanylate cyclase domain-containing protein [Limnothrix sp.]
MKFFARSLTFKLVGYFSALSLLMVSAVGAIALWESKKALQYSIFERLETTANLQEETLNIWFENRSEHYEALGNNSELRLLVASLLASNTGAEQAAEVKRDLYLLLQREIATDSGALEFFILDNANGKVAFSTQTNHVGQSYKDTDIFQEGLRQASVRYPQPNDDGFIFSQPIKGQYQEFIGVLVVRLKASELARVVLQFHEPEMDQYNYIVTAKNHLLTDDEALRQAWVNRPAEQTDLLQQAIAGNRSESQYNNVLGQSVLGLYRWLPEQELALFIEIDRQQAYAPLRRLIWIVVGVGGVVLGLAIAGSYAIARLITKPILAIKETATEVTQGNISVRAPQLGDDEIGMLAETFNQMIEEFSLLYEDFNNQVTQLEMAEISAQHSFHELQTEKKKVDEVMEKLTDANDEISLLNERLKTENLDLAAEIQETNKRLNQFLEAIPVGILVLDGIGEIVYVNRRAQSLLGGDEDPIEQIVDCPIYLTESELRCPPEKVLGQRALRREESSTYDDIEVRRGNMVIPLESWETPILDSNGVVRYAIVAFQDITERRQAEREKQNYTRKLWQLNQANERFVPREFLQLLDRHSIVDVNLGDNIEKEMTVLFADIRGFTQLSEGMSPEDNFKFINAFLSRMNPAISHNAGFIDKYIGDAIMALFSRLSHADDALQAAIAMLQTLEDYNNTRKRPDRMPIRIGLGLNSGLMRCGTVGGHQHMESTVISDAVNLASRLERLTKVYRTSLLISHHTFMQLQEHDLYHIRLIDHVTVAGKSVAVSVYEVFDADPPAIAAAKKASKSNFEQAFVLYRLKQFIRAQKLFQTCLRNCPEDYVSQLYIERCQQNMINSFPKRITQNNPYLDGKF